MVNVALIEPQIPQNTGNIARLCAATGSTLYLVGRLGFEISDKYLRRSGLDYWDKVKMEYISSISDFEGLNISYSNYFLSTKATKNYSEIPTDSENILLTFGNEVSGLPPEFYERYSKNLFRIPMVKSLRCLNLSSAVAVVLYDVLRRQGFTNLE